MKRIIMYYLFGRKEKFAVEIDLKGYWNNKTAIWLDNKSIGDWNNENLLAPFIISLYRVSMCYEDFTAEEIFDLSCPEIYSLFEGKPNSKKGKMFSDLVEIRSKYNIDKFHLEWGENFDSFGLRMIYKKGVCKFIWRNTPNNEILCQNISLEVLKSIYIDLSKVIKDDK